MRTDALTVTELRAQLRALVDDLAAQGRPEVTIAADGGLYFSLTHLKGGCSFVRCRTLTVRGRHAIFTAARRTCHGLKARRREQERGRLRAAFCILKLQEKCPDRGAGAQVSPVLSRACRAVTGEWGDCDYPAICFPRSFSRADKGRQGLAGCGTRPVES